MVSPPRADDAAACPGFTGGGAGSRGSTTAPRCTRGRRGRSPACRRRGAGPIRAAGGCDREDLGGEGAVEKAARDRVDGHPRAGELDAVGDQAVDRDRHGEREQRGAGQPVRQRHSARRARQRQLAVHPQGEQDLQPGQGQRDGRQQRLERYRAGAEQAERVVGLVQPARHIHCCGHAGGQQPDPGQAPPGRLGAADIRCCHVAPLGPFPQPCPYPGAAPPRPWPPRSRAHAVSLMACARSRPVSTPSASSAATSARPSQSISFSPFSSPAA